MTRSKRILLRRARRPFLIFLSLPIALLLLRLVWGYYADHQLAQAQRHFAARGHHVTPDQFAEPPLPPDRNAAPLILEAINALTLTALQSNAINGVTHMGGVPRIRWSDAERTEIRTAIAANARMLALIDRALQRPQAQWPTFPLDSLGRFRGLANFLSAAAIIAHDDGDDPLALLRISQLSQLSVRFTSEPRLITHLVVTATMSVAAGDIERLHATLSIPTNSPTTVQARLLITDFLNDAPHDSQRLTSQEFLLASHELSAREESPATQSWLIRPAFTLGWARLYDRKLPMIEALAAHSWQPIAPFQDAEPSSNLDHITYHGIFRLFPRAIALSYRGETERHAAAILVAAALYRVDHAGQNPPSLPSLVPHYLPTLPSDPFTFPVTALNYSPAPQLLVWSVGEDGIDDHGSATPLPGRRERGRWGARDAVYGPLSLEPPP